MTTIFKLEVEEDVLARAEEAAKARGGDVRTELLSRLEELGGSRLGAQYDVMQRFVARAEANPVRLVGDLPAREERNAR